jgi:hypothetical protein
VSGSSQTSAAQNLAISFAARTLIEPPVLINNSSIVNGIETSFTPMTGQQITGTGRQSDQIEIYDVSNGVTTLIGTGMVNSQGQFNVLNSIAIPSVPGVHQLYAIAIDPSNHLSSTRSNLLNFTMSSVPTQSAHVQEAEATEAQSTTEIPSNHLPSTLGLRVEAPMSPPVVGAASVLGIEPSISLSSDVSDLHLNSSNFGRDQYGLETGFYLRNNLKLFEVKLTSGHAVEHELPFGTFVGGVGALSYSGRLANGASLPAWISIDEFSGKLSIQAPLSEVNDQVIVIRARDNLGHEASTVLTIKPSSNSEKMSLKGKPSLRAQMRMAERLRA